MAITSCTTAVAFYANYFSDIMPIKAFGVFAGTIIIVNYVLVCFLFTTVIAAYEGTLKKYNLNNCRRRIKNFLMKRGIS
jgi:protein dispatched 1